MRVALLIFVLSALASSESAKILAAVPFPSISHQLAFRLVALELARRGHDVTFITTDPIKEPISNYTEVDISPAYRYLRTYSDWVSMAMKEWNPMQMLSVMERVSANVCEDGLKSPEMQNFINSAPKFDVIVLERLLTPCFYGLVHRVGSPPVIGFVSQTAFPHTHTAHRNPSNPAYLPDWLLPFSDHMSFSQRLYSTYSWLRLHYSWFNIILPRHEEIQRKYFGPDVPSVFETERNFSLMLINNHFSINYPRPNLPNMIELTGLHFEHKPPETLPKDLQDWLDGAEAGVVYFSLGSNVKASTMPEDKRRAFVDAFAHLQQRVLWKWEADNMKDLPPNVKLSKWLPQQSVLAHPKVQAFITQGGLQSYNEAAYHSVPMIGIPFLGDQHHIVAKMVSAGIGYQLQFRHVTKDTVTEAIRAILEDGRYKENMRRFSKMYREHQAESLQRAVWWIEYVLRHNGAPHLRSAALDLSWHQLLLLDVVAFVAFSTAASVYVMYVLLRLLISVVSKHRKQKKH